MTGADRTLPSPDALSAGEARQLHTMTVFMETIAQWLNKPATDRLFLRAFDVDEGFYHRANDAYTALGSACATRQRFLRTGRRKRSD